MSEKRIWETHAIKNYKTVSKIQKQLRKGNWTYLYNHPEIRAIIRVFMHEAINQNPENVYTFAAKLFDCNNSAELIMKINKQLKSVNAQKKRGLWGDYDADAIIEPKESSHSLLSNDSVDNNLDALLRFSYVIDKDGNVIRKK